MTSISSLFYCQCVYFLVEYVYMKLTVKEVEQIATLARLELTEKEKKLYAEQLSVVLDYISMLNEVNTDGVPETCQVTGLEDVVREDVPINCDEETKQKLINAFPERMAKLLKVKAVFLPNSEPDEG